MSNELVPQTSFALAPMDNSLLDMIREELDGLGSIPFDFVKIPSGGGVAFEVPGDDPDNPDVVKELTGVIVEHHPMNSYWADAYSGGNAAPDCASMDGKTGIVAATGECIDCSMCKFNQFGSDTDGRGKACKNLHRIYILREGEVLPVIFNVPPTSLRPFKDYLAKRLLLKGKRANQVVTRITLKKAQNAGGISYSQAVFSKAADLTPEQMELLQPTIKAVREMARQVPVEFIEQVDSDEPAPFEE